MGSPASPQPRQAPPGNQAKLALRNHLLSHFRVLEVTTDQGGGIDFYFILGHLSQRVESLERADKKPAPCFPRDMRHHIPFVLEKPVH